MRANLQAVHPVLGASDVAELVCSSTNASGLPWCFKTPQ
jgi:hypothetical protein